jgi:hypothetical protein
MTLFFRRFLGALSLDAGAFEDIEASRNADMQAMAVLLAACAAGGIGAIGLGVTGAAGFVVSALLVLGAWLVWAGLIATLGTTAMADVDTRSDVHELLRVLGYAAAPGVFLAFAAMRAVAPLMVLLVIVWMIAAAVLGVRQALDFRSTARAAAVCVIAFVLSAGAMTAVALLLSRTVS